MRTNLEDVVHGVQAIIMVESHHNYLEQKYIMVQDYNDRGRNDGILKYGLSGGGMYTGEHHKAAVHREVTKEEIGGLDLDIEDFKKFGCYQKLRPNGTINDNYLYIVKLDYVPNKKQLTTKDPREVSEVHILTLDKIIGLAKIDHAHEGSIRLIFNFLNGIRTGSLNDPVTLNGYTF